MARERKAAPAPRASERRRRRSVRVVSPTDAREAAARTAVPGAERLRRKLREHPPGSAKLSGRDVDAAWDRADAGEEAVGGSRPTPDQDNVDDAGPRCAAWDSTSAWT